METFTKEKHRLWLRFHDQEMEQRFVENVVSQGMKFVRLTWLLVIFLTSIWGALDQQMFGAAAATVTKGRLVSIAISLCMLLLSWWKPFRKVMLLSSPVFILNLSLFSMFLMVMSGSEGFSPYFTAIIMAQTGIFMIPGAGFRYNLPALAVIPLLFHLIISRMGVGGSSMAVYHFYLWSMLIIFAYISFWLEWRNRQRYSSEFELEHSNQQVRQLSGLLPVCASCHKIRDDQGYWNELESYIEKHTEALFTHGLCQSCEETLYGKETWYQKRKKRQHSD